jgi:hypothetical protein
METEKEKKKKGGTSSAKCTHFCKHNIQIEVLLLSFRAAKRANERRVFEKAGEPDLFAGPLGVLLHPPPVLAEGEGPVGRRLGARADGRVVRRAQEVGDG